MENNEYDELNRKLSETQEQINEYNTYEPDPRKTHINPTIYPDAALEQDYLRMESAESILKDVERLYREGVFTMTTCNVLKSLVNPLIGHDFALGTYEGHRSVALKSMFDIDTIIACRGIPREDRDTIEFINIINMIKFQYGIEETRGIPDTTGLNERSRKHISIGETRHILRGQNNTPQHKKSLVDFLMRRGQPREVE